MHSRFNRVPFLPETVLEQLAPGITLSHPLSRRGYGPGFIVLVPHTGTASATTLAVNHGVPSPLMKWAEESYTVVEITEAALNNVADALNLAVAEIAKRTTTNPKDIIGLVAYSPALWNRVADKLSSVPQVVGAAVYGHAEGPSIQAAPSSVPVIQHLAGKATNALPRTEALTAHDYPTVGSFLFATPFQEEFNYNAETVSHTRNLTFFKKLMNGPYFDLEDLWEEHTYYEFENRSLECTMGTMVQEPYVNHIPTLTGGIGRAKLTEFYRDHFIFHNPQDIETELISRSMGIDRVMDEYLFKCTHNQQIDWLAPGIPPTGRKLVVPFNAVVNFRGDRLYHEHIWWDQATVLKQLELLPEYLPYPHAPPNELGLVPGKRLEYRVPTMGQETAMKVLDKYSLPSNTMFEYKIREASN
ncbi:hypothetical protein DL765_006545 [Monosporascus sp. GIB2]|nr:hypothetical protein DL765_006545 [Monosporascus sp. GIB2]